MRSLINSILVSAAILGSVSVAEAMPAAMNPAPAASAIVGAQVDKTVVIVTKRVVRRPRVIVRRPARVMKKIIVR